MNYRPEIDGLRSVAVLPVIFFHAGFAGFGGGYVGVDVFFVISGYLITTILIGEREAGTYSLLGFYERRARRILPALFLVLVATIPFAWRWIPPDPFEDYARSLAFAAMFISNIHFIEHSGYFDTAAQLRPLLHTWSLAVEEQYYLFFPLVLWALGAFSRARFIWVFLGLSALSLGVAEWGLRNHPLENFFFTPSRLWELLGGSICAALLYDRAQPRHEALAAAGLALILLCVFLYDTSVRFPSLYTLGPVLGSMLIILFAGQGTRTAWILSLRPMVWIGLLSYSAYLWHQPIFVLARIRTLPEPGAGLMVLLILLTFALAYLSWRYVETPFRTRRWFAGRAPLLGTALAGILVFAAFGLSGDYTKGFPARLDRLPDDHLASARAQISEWRAEDNCIEPAPEPYRLCTVYRHEGATETVALLGDSHAQVLLPAFRALSEARNLTVLRGVKPACPPLLGVYLTYGKRDAQECFDTVNALAVDVVQRGVDTVVLAARWSIYASGDYSGEDIGFMVSRTPGNQFQSREDWNASFEEGVRETVAFYRRAGIRVILIPQLPQQQVFPENVLLQAQLQELGPEDAGQVIRNTFVARRAFRDLTAYADGVLARAAGELGAEILSLNTYFEEGDRYAWFRDGEVYYSDADHLTLRGALALAPLLIKGYARDD